MASAHAARRPAAGILSCRWGGIVVEFAFLLPLFTLVLMGLWDFGQVLQENSRIINAARAGLQYGMQSPGDSLDLAGIARAARNDAQDAAAALDITAERSCRCPNGQALVCGEQCGSGDRPEIYLSVRVQSTVAPTFPYPILERPFPLSQEVVGRVQ